MVSADPSPERSPDTLVRFPVSTFATVDPLFVDPQRDGSRDTCLVWTVHLDTGASSVAAVQAFGERLALLPSVRGFTGGDCFAAWAEPFVDDAEADGPGRALHVYFDAASQAAATTQARLLCLRTHLPLHMTAGGAVLSTGADWSQQVALWPAGLRPLPDVDSAEISTVLALLEDPDAVGEAGYRAVHDSVVDAARDAARGDRLPAALAQAEATRDSAAAIVARLRSGAALRVADGDLPREGGIACPVQTCGGDLVEVDVAERWNRLVMQDGAASASTDGDYAWERSTSTPFICDTCLEVVKVDLPDIAYD